MSPIFNNSWEYPRLHVWCKFGDSSSNLWRVIAWTSQISWNSKSKWPNWPWRSRSMTSIFNTSWEYLRMHIWCKFGDCSLNLCWVIARTSQISYNSESKWSKRPWRSRSMTSILNTSREYSRMHVCCKFVDSSSNLCWVIMGKVKFTDVFGEFDLGCHEASCTAYLLLLSCLLHIG